MLNRLRTLGFTLAWVLCAPARTPAQVPPTEEDSPRVQSLVFEGVESLGIRELRESIVTRDTRCLGPLVKPLCLISGTDLFRTVYRLDREELARDVLRLRVTYFRRGYREVQAESEVSPEDDGVRVTFRVREGPLTTMTSLDLEMHDSVLGEGDLQDAHLPPELGPLDLVQLDSATARLQARLWDLGYARAKVEAVTDVDDRAHEATVTVRIDPGSVTTIGEIYVLGNESVSERTVLRLFELREGDVFRRTGLTAAQRRLWETELFQVSLVDATPTPDSTQDVRIFVREAPPRSITLGPGFNTTEFVQGEVRFTRYNWMGGARRLDTRAALGNLLAHQLYGKSIFGSAPGVPDQVDPIYLDPTWELGLTFTQPFFLTTKMSLGLGVSAHRRSIPGVVVDKGYGFDAAVTRRLADRWTLSLTYRFEETHIQASEVYFCVNFGICDPNTVEKLRSPHTISPLGIETLIDRVDDPTSLTDGYRVRARAEVASALTFSDFRHLQIEAEASRFVPVGRGALAGRVCAGVVWPLTGVLDVFGFEQDGVPILHPRHRFYSGGSRSVRGYGENQLGPRVLTIAPDELIFPADTVPAFPPCSDLTILDGTCDPNVAPSDLFQPQPLGGNTLLEATLEYRFPLGRSFTGAAFVDAGLLYGGRVNIPPGNRVAITPGVGVRYDSPLGPVRIDLSVRPAFIEDLPVVTQTVGRDGELFLIQLDRTKRYDPLGEPQGGFMSAFFSRLQLHLALGEAF